MFRCLFTFYPSFLDESNLTEEHETDREYFGRLAEEANEDYNKKEGTSFEFVKVENANVYMNSGYIYFITFEVKDPRDDNLTKIFQAKVRNVFCREIEHSFCRPKPDQEVICDEDSKKVVKKPRIEV